MGTGTRTDNDTVSFFPCSIHFFGTSKTVDNNDDNYLWPKWLQMMHHPPPASQATARGVERWPTVSIDDDTNANGTSSSTSSTNTGQENDKDKGEGR